MYRWFCPPGGMVLDPFAGGSVRGIVAAVLGRDYTGIDLRQEQVEANEVQAAAICKPPETVTVKISAASANLRFNGCDPEYIRDVCHSSCCNSSTAPNGTMITIHPSEEKAITGRGGVIAGGLLQPHNGARVCPFKTDTHLCGLHFTPDKPFGCIASPFTLNENGTLIVRNRYKMLRCYDDGPRLPAYVAFRASLDLIFGKPEAERICNHLSGGGGDLNAAMPRNSFEKLRDNDGIKKGIMPTVNGKPAGGPAWITGDSIDLGKLLPADFYADFVFSCPPYADLERYSDDPRDLSTMAYADFLSAYGTIINAACAKLRANRFAAFVVGDIRDKRGIYRNFVSDTASAFLAAGMELYNEAILVTAVGSLPIRVGKQFAAGRKLGKTHQNILVFVKGNPRKAADACEQHIDTEAA